MPSFVSIGQIRKPISHFRKHQHEDTWELVLYIQGQGTITVGEQRIPFRVGTVVCLPPRVPHEERSAKGFRNAHMHVRDFGTFDGTVPVFQDEQDRPYFHTSQLLQREWHRRHEHGDGQVKHLFELLMGYLRRWGLPQNGDQRVEALKSKLIEHLYDPEFQVADALDAVPLSGDHLRKLFRDQTGSTPLEYLNRLRVEEAKRLLRVGGYSIKEVAHQVGVGDSYYFSRMFRKLTGRAPSTYAR